MSERDIYIAPHLALLGVKGGPAIQPGSNMPTANLVRIGGKTVLVDAGLGVTRGIVDQNVLLRDIDLIVITHLHSEAAQATIAEIFERDGEAFFRTKEAQVIARLLNGAPAVLSTGGGAFLQEVNRTRISSDGISVHLNASRDLLWERVRHKDTRPLLRTDDPRATLNAIYDERAPVYALADLSVPSEAGLSIEEMAARVEEALAARPDVLEPAYAR